MDNNQIDEIVYNNGGYPVSKGRMYEIVADILAVVSTDALLEELATQKKSKGKD